MITGMDTGMDTGLTLAQLALTGAGLLGFGYAVLAAMALNSATRAMARDLLQVFFSATVIALVLIAAGLLGTPAIVALMIAIAFRVGYEAAFVRIGRQRPGWAGGIATVCLCLATMLDPRIAFAMLGIWVILLARLARSASIGTPSAVVDLLVFPILPMALMAYGAVSEDLRLVVIGSYILVEIFDSCALLSGKLFGKTKAFPVLSPRKTVEGLAGAVIGLCLLTALMAGLLDLSVGRFMTAAVAVALLAVAGDLAASRLKREAGVKDFPVLLQHQGGLLDSLDSWIAAGAGLVAVSFIMTLM